MGTEITETKTVNPDGTITAMNVQTVTLSEYRKSPGLTNRFHCQHEYPDNTWKCTKCGYQIPPGLIAKIADTGSGREMSTNV
ncbi:MAG TPA: hypothetical protein VE862_09920 [Candidatus Acidoferrum sp.]|nr:hypothetical protein [Candidatus Acidoferrum sp.]